MLTHIVLFKLKDRAVADTARARLAALDGQIEELKSLEVGVDVVQGERSFDIALVAKFDDRKGLEAYRVHPVHVEVANYIKGESSSIVSADYE